MYGGEILPAQGQYGSDALQLKSQQGRRGGETGRLGLERRLVHDPPSREDRKSRQTHGFGWFPLVCVSLEIVALYEK